MLVLVLCHFRAPVVNDLVVKLRLNFKKWWATAPRGRAAMPVVVWCCRFGIKETLKCVMRDRLWCRTASRHLIARKLWLRDCLVRPSISICLVTALQQRICPVPKSLRLQSC